jgi:hypothetical protein
MFERRWRSDSSSPVSSPCSSRSSHTVTPASVSRLLRSSRCLTHSDWLAAMARPLASKVSTSTAAGNGQRAFGHHIEAFGLAVRILEPEYLDERDRLALSRYSMPWHGLTSTGPSRLSS